MRFSIMTNRRWHLLFAAIAGVALRLFFVLHFPASSGDTPIYEDLATNWLKHGVYGISTEAYITPTDMRVPGYPAVLAAIYALTGQTGLRARLFVMLAQVCVDLGTCFLAAALARSIAPKTYRQRVGVVTLWLAVTCPFLANYTAVPLTETLATFFTTLALLMFVRSLKKAADNPVSESRLNFGANYVAWSGAFLVGVATLIRPESPLLLVAFMFVFIWKMRRRLAWRPLVLACAALAILFLIPLLPWVARNAITLHKLQFLAPRYAQLPSEVVPRGFSAWEKTWLVRMRDAYLVSWKLDEEQILIQDIPDSAFDSPSERERVAALLAEHNRKLAMTQEIDNQFAALAAERTARKPLRTYLWLPLRRAFTIWFSPRIELLPYSGHLRPLAGSWADDPVDFSVTLGFFLLNLIYAGLALTGFWRAWRFSANEDGGKHLSGVHLSVALIIIFIATRTAFLTTVEAPEPRYVLECFPAVLALVGLSFLPLARDESSRDKSAGIVL